ncbi:hypothetical protein DL769_000846 [Monosporascus sp. CRB-8-3]|nr:hypothetical protein DL769_000846 [Monosporascus sp. CRB-8-3]
MGLLGSTRRAEKLREFYGLERTRKVIAADLLAHVTRDTVLQDKGLLRKEKNGRKGYSDPKQKSTKMEPSGIGFMMAKALARAGAKQVYILGRRQSALGKAMVAHSNIAPLPCEVTSKESLQSAVDVISKETGFINLLIANSGIYGPPKSFAANDSIQDLRKRLFEEVSMESFTETFHVNVTGAYFTLLAFLELLDAGNKKALEGGYGAPAKLGSKVPTIQSQVIITSSVSGFSRDKNSCPAYAGSKAAITHLVKHASTNLAVHGIRVNALAPGIFPSEIADIVINSRDVENEPPGHPSFIPARRFGREEEMTGTILYLASIAGSYCNGLILNF